MDGQLVDVGLEDGLIARLEPDLESSGKRELDLQGRLTLPAFVNGQLHACKAFWERPLAILPEAVRALPRMAAFRHVKRAYTAEDVAARADEAVRLALLNGTCAIRLFADVDEDAELRGLEGLLEVKARYEPLMRVQVVAFPQEGLSDVTEALMREAMELGADVAGGIPWVEPTEAARREHVSRCLALAQEFGRDLHLVCDDTTDPASRTLELLAEAVLETGFTGRVAATQCAALAFYEDAHAAEVVRRVKAAGITVFCNAHVSLVTTPHEGEPYPRGITRVRELLAAGVPVACAQDDLSTPYYPFGRNDPLEVAHFMAHAAGLAWGDDLSRVLEMVTQVPAEALGLESYGLAVGCAADLVVLEATGWPEALQFQADKRYVFLKGRPVAGTRREGWLDLPAPSSRA